MKEVYETIRNLREDRDLKQKDVADFLKMSRTTYNHYELGHSSFTADMIIDLAHFFGTTPNVLLNFNSKDEITDLPSLKLCKKILILKSLFLLYLLPKIYSTYLS